MGRKYLLFFILLLFIATNTWAEEEAEPVQVSLHMEEQARPGTSFWVRVDFAHSPGWHTYWKNPGEAGSATAIEWKLPQGFSVRQTLWPTPQLFEDFAIETLGYQDTASFWVEIAVDNSVDPASYTIEALASALACSHELCHPIESTLTQSLSISKQATQNLASPPSQQILSLSKGSSPLCTLPFQPEKATFIPAEEGAAPRTLTLHKVDKTDDNCYSVTLNLDDKMGANDGVVVFSNTLQKHVQEVSFFDEKSPSTNISSFFLLCAFAFAGGAILNLMPCVLPVISLKILSFVNMGGEDKQRIFLHGVAFTAGVVLSFWALASVLLLLKAYGSQVGWGFQLQDPRFIAFLILLLFIFGLSMLGVFEIGTSLASQAGSHSQKEGYTGSFLSGALATIVATPCTGPFLGPAIGASLSLSPLHSLTIFTFIALGLSSPYLILSLFPRLTRYIPKPGPWTNTFKEICGFILLATVLWLLWVFEALSSSEGVITLLAALLLAGFGAYCLRTLAAFHLPRKSRRYGVAFAAVTFLFAASVTYYAANTPPPPHESTHLGFDKYSAEKLQSYLDEGKTVFVDFTAKWCLICQANKFVLHSHEVEKLFKENNVVILEADWTKKDPTLTQELAKQGRGGVPLYLLYSPDNRNSPAILPQILTPGIIKQTLKLG